MFTPSPPTFQHLLDVLNGVVPAPHTKFISCRGPLAPQQVDQLANAIRDSPAQGGVRLKGCLIGDSGAEALASALAINQNLETLELPGNAIGQQGARRLLACLGQNNVLTTVDLEDNPCCSDAPGTMEEIDAALNRNRMLSQSTCPGTPTPGRVSEAAPSSHHVPTLPLTSLKTGSTSGRHVLQSSTKENLSASVAPEGATNRISNNDMIDLERRLQQLERQYQQQSTNVKDSEAELVRMVEWKQSSDAASDKVADVLGALQLEQDDHRSALQELGTFQGQLLTGGQQMADRLVSMRHDWRGLEEEVAQLKAAMSEGVLQIRAEAAARAQDAAEQVRVACKGALDQVWDSVEALETDRKTLGSQVTGVEAKLQHMQQHTDKLDTYINDMLKQMLGTLNQGQERLKVDVQQLSSTVQGVQQKLQHDMAEIGQVLERMRGRRQAALPWRPGSQEMVLDHILGRLTSLESAVTEANKFAEAEAVRCEQSEAVTENLLARSQMHDKLLAQHNKVLGCQKLQQQSVSSSSGDDHHQVLSAEASQNAHDQRRRHGSEMTAICPSAGILMRAEVHVDKVLGGCEQDKTVGDCGQADTGVQLAPQTGAHAALQHQVHQQAAAIAALQNQLASLLQQSPPAASGDTLQGPAQAAGAVPGSSHVDDDISQDGDAAPTTSQVVMPTEPADSMGPSMQQAAEVYSNRALTSDASWGVEAGSSGTSGFTDQQMMSSHEQQMMPSTAGSVPQNQSDDRGQVDASRQDVLINTEEAVIRQIAPKQAQKAKKPSTSHGGKQSRVGMRRPWFTVKWCNAPHRFL